MSAKKRPHSLINDYLEALGVEHTCAYSDQRFGSMPFKTLFGFSKLLEEYGIRSEGYLLSDKGELYSLTPPFIADTAGGFVIVTALSPGKVTYLTQGVEESADFATFAKAWNGNVFLSFPSDDAREPDYAAHARLEFFMRAKRWVLGAAVSLLIVYLIVANRLYDNIWTLMTIAVDIGGIYFTYLLVQKSVRIHNPAADKVCKVLQAGGCDSILETKASKFFGLFGWSEVGFAYFSVSLITLLLVPGIHSSLALCNICCLPFTFWSIWYQRFKAHKWCTLCVCVQASLWLLFFTYLFGGYIQLSLPIVINAAALGLGYLSVMLTLNAVMPLIENNKSIQS